VLEAADLDGDGDQDLIAGNRGLNTQMKVGVDTPASLYALDVDRNGTLDTFTSAYMLGQEVLIHWRDVVVSQVPVFAERFPTHESYATATVEDVFTETERARATRLVASVAASSVFEDFERRPFRRTNLTRMAQVAPIQDILVEDINGDTRLDLVVIGNEFGMRAAVGRQNAGRGLLLVGDGQMGFKSLGPAGLYASQDARKMRWVDSQRGPLLLVTNSDGPLEVYAWQQGDQ